MSAIAVVEPGPHEIYPDRWTRGARAVDPPRRARPARRAHLRRAGHQEGALRDGRIGPRLAAQGAPLLRARRPFPCAAFLPAGHVLQAAGAAAARRRLRQGARLLVHRRALQARPADQAGEAAEAGDARRPAARLPRRARAPIRSPGAMTMRAGIPGRER